jgi:hypothetical protein
MTRRGTTVLDFIQSMMERYDWDGPINPPEFTQEVKLLKPNQATSCCLRGPCIYRVFMVSQTKAQSRDKVLSTKRLVGCQLHSANMDPDSGDLQFYCAQWVPCQLAWVPEHLWPMFEPYVRMLWERALEALGYSFHWRVVERYVKDSPIDRAIPYTIVKPPEASVADEGYPAILSNEDQAKLDIQARIEAGEDPPADAVALVAGEDNGPQMPVLDAQAEVEEDGQQDETETVDEPS